MTWDNLQRDILEAFADAQAQDAGPSYEELVRVHRARKARAAVHQSDWAWRQRRDPEYWRRRRANARAHWRRLKQDPVRLAAYRARARVTSKLRRQRLAEEQPERWAEEKARRVQATQRWRARRQAEDPEGFAARRRAEVAKWLEGMTPEQRAVHREKHRIRNQRRRRNLTTEQKAAVREYNRTYQRRRRADPERQEELRKKQREYNRRWREKRKKAQGC